MAAALALYVVQWAVVSHLDARSAAAIQGRRAAPLWALVLPQSSGNSQGAASRGGSAAGWPQALQHRALLLSALMDSRDDAPSPTPFPPPG